MRLVPRYAECAPEGWRGISPILEVLLRQRGIATPEQAAEFLSPRLAQLPPYATLYGVDSAVERLKAAVSRDERIVVYGDYDADGVTAAAVMAEALTRCGARHLAVYIPLRAAEGYGLNVAAIEKLAPEADLIVTVDLGITALDEVRHAAHLGLDVIVTDHHHRLEALPQTPWIVHPSLGGDPRWSHLSGAGVAWVLASALGGTSPMIDLAALGTVADLVPLKGVNRILAAEGLRRMNEGLRPGLAALARVAGIGGKPITATTLAFAFAPRINAGGRMAASDASVHMLLAPDEDGARAQADALQRYNQARVDEERAITGEAEQRIEGMERMGRAIILEGDWHPGVVGIVASRLAERYHVPAILLCRDGDILSGSGRSVPGVHLFSILESMSECFIKFGGHAMAAGMTLRRDKLGALTEAFFQAMDACDPDVFLPRMVYDLEIDPGRVDLELAGELERMAPYGAEHPAPLFLTRETRLSGVRAMGDGSHLKGRLGPLTAVAFRMADRREAFEDTVDLVYSIDRNEWNGRAGVQLIVRDARTARRDANGALPEDGALRAFLASIRYNSTRHGEGSPELDILDEDRLRRYIERIAGDPTGCLLLCAQPGTADAMLDRFDAYGARHRLALCKGKPPGHPRALGAVVLAPEAEHPFFGRYTRVLWCDGIWDPGCARALAGKDQAVYRPPGWLEGRAEAARRALPDLQCLRGLWRALRGSDPAKSIRDIRRSLGGIADPLRLEIGLYALRDAGQVDFADEGPSGLRFPEGGLDPTGTGFYALLRTWMEDADR